MNGAPFGSLLALPLILLVAGCIAIGVGLGMLIPRPALAADTRQCVVIDMHTQPGPGKLVPAPAIDGSKL